MAPVTAIVIVDVPAAVGVPLTSPVVGSKFRPAGKVPLVIANDLGEVPPAVTGVIEYPESAVPLIPVFGAVIVKAAVTRSVVGEVEVIVPPTFVAVPLTAMYLPICEEVNVKVVFVAPAISTQVERSLADVHATH